MNAAQAHQMKTVGGQVIRLLICDEITYTFACPRCKEDMRVIMFVMGLYVASCCDVVAEGKSPTEALKNWNLEARTK